MISIKEQLKRIIPTRIWLIFSHLLMNLRFLLRLVKSSQRKHTISWIESLQEDYLLKRKLPWIVFDAIDFLNSMELKGMNIFEYGSGGSTLYWVSKGASVVSIEHDPIWYNKIYKILQENKKRDYRFVEQEIEPENLLDPSNPEYYITNSLMQKKYFKKYVLQIDEFENNFFDIISIDGRARPSCIKHSVNKVKVGGLIIIDNAEREYYFEKTEPYLKNFELKSFDGVGPINATFWKTNVYKRLD